MALKDSTDARLPQVGASEARRTGRSRPRFCPACGSQAVLRIVYGMPGEEMRRKAEAGLIALGGCVIEEDQPRAECGDCGHQW